MIGDLKTSLLTEKSCDLIYQFYENKTDAESENIIFIGFPKKSNFSFLLATNILTRLLKDDLLKVKVNTHLRTLDKGDKIIFFGKKRAEFNSFSAKYIHFHVKGHEYFGNRRMITKVRAFLPIIYGNYLRKYKGTATSNHSLKDILIAASERRGNLRAKEKLLLNDKAAQALGVPSGLLKSKILLITGNGNKYKFKKWANNVKIYEESVKLIFKENLVIEKDLKNFKNFFSVENISERVNYNDFATSRLFELANSYPQLEDPILELIFDFEKGDYNQENLFELREDIKTLFGDELNIFNVLIERLPKYSSPLPSGLKMVIIDSLEVVQNYKSVIEGLINLKVKVVCTYDLNDFKLSNPFPFSPKFFWNREKIKTLINSQNQQDFTDKNLFNRALCFSNHDFLVSIYDDEGFADLYWRIYTQIKDTEGKENLVALFWTKIHPIYFLIKNSPNIDRELKNKCLDSLENDLCVYKNGTARIEDLFQEFIIKAKSINNRKVLENGNVLSQEITLGSQAILLPNGVKNESLKFIKNVDSHREGITVSGIPYKEYQLSLVDDLIRNCLVPKIKFLCWGREFTYLKKIILSIEKSEWHEDRLITTLAKQSACPIDTDKRSTIITENDFRIPTLPEEDSYEYEEVAQRQSSYYHSRYKGENGSYTKKSVTIYLKSNQWIYIPINDNVYFFDQNKNTIGQKKGSKLIKSDIIVLFNISKRDIRSIGSSNENMDRVFEDLEIWSNALDRLFEGSNKNYATLENKLKAYKTEVRKKANPNKVNLSRWLDDNDLTLAPWIHNLEVILDAADLVHEKQKILAASKKISKYERQFRKSIKKEILRRSHEFIVEEDEIITKSITVNGVSVKVTSCKVLSIDKEILDIDNSYVKKII